jgi:hypothetical protein
LSVVSLGRKRWRRSSGSHCSQPCSINRHTIVA